MRTQSEVTGMPCPVCKIPLTMSDRQGIEIDYCPQCRGIWLDRGELDKIIERSADSTPPAPQPQQAPPPQTQQPNYQHPHGYDQSHGKYGYKRKKSWLEDIFD